MPYHTSEQITQDYKQKFKELLRQKAGPIDKELEELCAEVAWQSFGWQTLEIISQRQHSQACGVL